MNELKEYAFTIIAWLIGVAVVIHYCITFAGA